MKDDFKMIPDFPCYKVNSEGIVKVEDRLIMNSNCVTFPAKGCILKQRKGGRGYQMVCLSMPSTGRKNKYVHRLVAEAFIPNPDNLPTVNHIDGNKENNCVENLEWCSYSDNNQHTYDNNLHGKGEKHYNSLLTKEQVDEIRRLGKYDTFDNIGQKYGVSRATIRDVLLYRTWKE